MSAPCAPTGLLPRPPDPSRPGGCSPSCGPRRSRRRPRRSTRSTPGSRGSARRCCAPSGPWRASGPKRPHGDDDFMTITQLAQALGVRSSTLRFWEEEGLVRPERVTTLRARRYGLAAIRAARVVVALRAAWVRHPGRARGDGRPGRRRRAGGRPPDPAGTARPDRRPERGAAPGGNRPGGRRGRYAGNSRASGVTSRSSPSSISQRVMPIDSRNGRS